MERDGREAEGSHGRAGSSRVTAQEAPAPTPQTQGFQPFLGSPSPPFPFQGFAGLPGSPSASPRPLNPFFTGTFNGQPTGNPFLPPLVGPNQQFAFPVPAGFPGSAVPGPQFQGFPGSPLTGRPPPQGITNGFPGQFSHPGSFHIQPNLAGHSRFPAGSFPETSPISPLREVPTGFPAAVNEGQISGRGLEFGDEDFVGLSGGSPTMQAPISPVTPLSSPPTTPFVPETTPATSPPTSTAKPATTTTASTTSQPSTTPTTTTTTSTPPPTTSVTPSTTTTTSTPPPTTSVTPPSTTTTTPPPTTTTTTATTPPPTTTTNLPSTTTSPTTTSASTAQPADSVVSSTTASRPIAGHKSRTHTGSSLASRLQNFAQQASNDRGEGREKVLQQPPQQQPPYQCLLALRKPRKRGGKALLALRHFWNGSKSSGKDASHQQRADRVVESKSGKITMSRIIKSPLGEGHRKGKQELLHLQMCRQKLLKQLQILRSNPQQKTLLSKI
ncbi:hypothetical protein C7M84_024122 [Penaeus vannamei]|uniref:Uncharacterized protein n=1 Tax=Penaeus vannamei TaxID=6689 RepID=A0A423U1Y3_PENVA|nr:hypothetical protein C7M84_024122 [Penaeus vannamei]